MDKARKRAKVGDFCVACGACIVECPRNAISIPRGIKANIDLEACVGCGKCCRICPASTIEIITLGVEYAKKAMV